jgi:SAM-dependent methyltransferase
MVNRVNYDAVAPTYNQRYEQNPLSGVARELYSLVEQNRVGDALEVGCGTGRWLTELYPVVHRICGLDFSLGMLQQARARHASLPLVGGDASHLPFPAASFDFVFTVNAVHHFSDKQAFIREARRVLRIGGALAIVNTDPHIGRDQWCLYDYFDGTRAADQQRFPSSGTLLDWMLAAGFCRAEWRVAEHIQQEYVGPAVLDSPFTQKNGTSQLALLTEAAYAAGIERLRVAIATAQARGEQAKFISDLWLILLVGWV